MSDTEALIIGGGISGLATAWWLAQHGIQAEVWERAARPGGKILSTLETGYLTERAAGILLNHRPEIDRLIEQTGLGAHKRSRGKDAARYVVHRGRLEQVPMRVSRLAASPLWSTRGKLRLLGEVLIPRSSGHESVSRFVTRRLGREVLETAMDPFIAGTLASDPDLADAAAVLPRLTELERRYGSLTLGMLVRRLLHRRRTNLSEAFSFSGGMSQLVEALAAAPGIRWQPGHELEEIEPVREGWRVSAQTPDGRRTRCVRHLILCTPAPAAAGLIAPFAPALAALLRGIEYAPLAAAHIGLARQAIAHALDGSGFLVPRREALSFNGNLWMSRLFPGRAPAGKALLSSYLGGSRHPERCDWSDGRMIDSICTDLGKLIGLRGDPEFIRIDRHRRALPLYHGDYLGRLSAISDCLARWTGLHLTANYIGGVSVRERIFQGMKNAEAIAATYSKRRALSEDNRQNSGFLHPAP